MSEHSKEPWAVDFIPGGNRPEEPDHRRYEVDDAAGNLVASMNPWPPGTDENGRPYPGCGGDPEANARRIVACVNACRGLTTEEMERMSAGYLCEVLRGLLRDRTWDYQ